MEVFYKKSLLFTYYHLVFLCVVFFLGCLSVTNAQTDIPDNAPAAVSIESPSFPDNKKWYASDNGLFTWVLPEDVTDVAVEVADDPDHEPQIVLDSLTEEYTVTADELDEGVNYFQLQFKNEAGWGEISSREVRIDTTPPPYVEFIIEEPESENGWPILLFAGDDATSGIDGYEIQVANREPVYKTAKEARFGHLIRDIEDGAYPVVVTAFDKAGNHSSVSGRVEINAGWVDPSSPKPVAVKENIEFTFAHWLIIFLAMVVAGQLVYIYRQYRDRLDAEARLRHETLEIRVQMEKIFTALRDEIYDQVATISKRSKLTKREKDTVATLTQALEVSETLIEKEVKDVQKLVKK